MKATLTKRERLSIGHLNEEVLMTIVGSYRNLTRMLILRITFLDVLS